jgi:hypothetical protein
MAMQKAQSTMDNQEKSEKPEFELTVFTLLVLFTCVILRVVFQFSGLNNTSLSDFLIFLLALTLCALFLKNYFEFRRRKSTVILYPLFGLPLFIYFGYTHSSWIRIDRDPGFIAVGAKIFQSANQLYFTFFNSPIIDNSHVLKTALGSGFDELSGGRVVLQDFPGAIQFFAFMNRCLSINGYPFLVGPFLALLCASILIQILQNLFGGFIKPLLFTIGFFLTIPGLYVFRSTFTESIELACMLLVIRLIQIFEKSNLYHAKKTISLIFFISGFSVLVRADAILTLLVPIQIYFIYHSSQNDEIRRFIRKIQPYMFFTIIVLILIDYAYSPVYFKANSSVLYAQTFTSLIMCVIIFIHKSVNKLSKFLLSRFIRTIFLIEFLTLIFLVLRSIGVIDFHSSDLWKIYPKSTSALSWYYSRPTLILYLASILWLAINYGKREISASRFMLAPLNGILIVTYFYDLGIAPDHPWASRRMVYFMIPLVFFTILNVSGEFKYITKLNPLSNAVRSPNISKFLVLAVVIGLIVPSKPFLRLRDRYDQPKYAQEVCNRIKFYSLGTSDPVFFSKSLSSWIHAIYSTCPGRFYIFQTETNPSYQTLKNIMGQEVTKYSLKDYLYVSSTPTSPGTSVRMSYPSYVATEGSRPKLRVILNETISISRVSKPFKGPRFVDGFYATENSDDGRFFAWSKALFSTLYLPSGMSIEILSADCAKGIAIQVQGKGFFEKFSISNSRPGAVFTNTSKLGQNFTISASGPQCRLSSQDARLSLFSIFMNTRY